MKRLLIVVGFLLFSCPFLFEANAASKPRRVLSAKVQQQIAAAKVAAARSRKVQLFRSCTRPCTFSSGEVAFEVTYQPSPDPRSPSYFWIRASRPSVGAVSYPRVNYTYDMQGRAFDPDSRDRPDPKVTAALTREAQVDCQRVVHKGGNCLADLFWIVPVAAAP